MKLRQLTSGEIEKLASGEGVRRIAVENFLSTMGDDWDVAFKNFELDSRLYKWNAPTRKAISKGIELAHGGKQSMAKVKVEQNPTYPEIRNAIVKHYQDKGYRFDERGYLKDDKKHRIVFKKLAFRHELLITYSDGNKEWKRIGGGYYKDFQVVDGKLKPIKRSSKLTVHRKGYTRKDGTQVKASTYQIEDQGAPGRGEKILPQPKKGSMTAYARRLGFIKKEQHIKDIPPSKIEDFALKLVKKIGKRKAFGMFHAQVILRKRKEKDPFLKLMIKGRDAISALPEESRKK